MSNLTSLQKLFLSALMITAVLFLSAKTRNEWLAHRYIGHVPTQRDIINIQGEGKITSQPTIAQVNVGVYSEGNDVAAVQRDNTDKVNAITASLKDLNIKPDDLQTSNYAINPRYDYKDGLQRLIGYSVSQQLAVKIRDLTKVGKALTNVGQLNANLVQGVIFTIEDPQILQAQARDKALADARAKAEALSKTLGVELIRVVGFSENGYQPPMPYPAMYRAEVASGAPAKDVDIQPGTLDTVSHVTVTYEIR
jgi:uncharacterized protein YggE